MNYQKYNNNNIQLEIVNMMKFKILKGGLKLVEEGK